MVKKLLVLLLTIIITGLIIYFIFLRERYPIHAVTHSFTIGDSIDSFNDVTVYNNGTSYGQSHGKHYSTKDSFYYGKKWQCVEFVKRYYYDHLKHKMPNGFGHAKDFFNKDLRQGELNKARGLIQFINGGNEIPKQDDLLIFDGEFGHVAIITKVDNDKIEVIQQNIYMTPRETYSLKKNENSYTIGEKRKPLGWLRLIK